MSNLLNEIILNDIFLLYSLYVKDNIFRHITIDLIHFLNDDIDIQFGNYSKLNTSMLMETVQYSKQKKKIIKIWSCLSHEEKVYFYNKMNTEFHKK
jgi:hypothetical protein